MYRYQSNTTQEVLDTIISVQPKEAGGGAGGESREASVSGQVKEMLTKLPPAYDPFEVKARSEKINRTNNHNHNRDHHNKHRYITAIIIIIILIIIDHHCDFCRLRLMDATASMNIFLKQEIDRMQTVIKLVRAMLKDLLLAIEGVIIMNEVIFLFLLLTYII